METPRRRVVSYKEYLLYLSLQAFLNLGLLLMGLTFLGGICFLGAWAEVMGRGTTSCLTGLELLLAASLCLLLAPIGWEYLRQVYEQQPPVLLLRGGVAEHLPVAESLLRGSAEPSRCQETVLLRAAHSCPDIPEDQLLRAAIQEEV